MRFTIKEPIYETEVYVFINEPPEKLIKHASRSWGVDVDPSQFANSRAIARTVTCGRRVWMWFNYKAKKITPRFMGALAHEVSHAVHHVCDDISFPMSYDGDEPIAYFQEFLVRTICEQFEKRKK